MHDTYTIYRITNLHGVQFEGATTLTHAMHLLSKQEGYASLQTKRGLFWDNTLIKYM